MPAVHLAVKEGRLADVQALLEHGANVNEVDLEGQTPLHTAAKCGQDRIADLLLNHGANMEAKDKWVSATCQPQGASQTVAACERWMRPLTSFCSPIVLRAIL